MNTWNMNKNIEKWLIRQSIALYCLNLYFIFQETDSEIYNMYGYLLEKRISIGKDSAKECEQ